MFRTWVWTLFSLAWWHTSVILELGVRDRQISESCCHTVKHKEWALSPGRNPLSINEEERDWGRHPSIRLWSPHIRPYTCVRTCIFHTRTKDKEKVCSALLHITDLPVLFITTTTPTPNLPGTRPKTFKGMGWSLGMKKNVMFNQASL